MTRIYTNALSDVLGIKVERGYEVYVIEEVVKALNDDINVHEALIQATFENTEPSDEIKSRIKTVRAQYEKKYRDALTLIGRDQASIAGYHSLKGQYEIFRDSMLQRAAGWGSPQAQFILGKKLMDRNLYESIYWLQRASDNGFYLARCTLATALFKTGEPDSAKKARAILSDMAKEGDYEAEFLLNLHRLSACLHRPGFAEKTDKIIENLIACADAGFPDGYRILGDLYHEKDVLDDEDKAVEFYKKAAEYGYVEAAEELCKYYSFIRDQTSNRDDKARYANIIYENARIVARDRSESGEMWLAYACTEMGYYDTAVSIYSKYEDTNGLAARQIGYLYQNGYGLPKSCEDAIIYYLKAMKLGYEEAEEDIAYAKLENNDSACIEMFEQFAANGSTKFYRLLSDLYEEGEIVEKNQEKAEYYKYLAETGENPQSAEKA